MHVDTSVAKTIMKAKARCPGETMKFGAISRHAELQRTTYVSEWQYPKRSRDCECSRSRIGYFRVSGALYQHSVAIGQ
jgi:hypothetical protein